MNDELTRRATVEAIVRVYDESERTITDACAAIAAAVERVNETLGSVGLTRDVEFGRMPRGGRFDWTDPSEHIHAMRRQLWGSLVERLELRRMMSTKRAEELDKWLSTTTEAITHESVFGLFRNYAESLPDMLAEAVEEVYSFLRPPSSKLVTNSQYEIGQKVILHGWTEADFLGGLRPSYYRRAEYVALDNVFSALDGKGSVAKSWRGELGDAVTASKAENDYRGQTTYFRFRACKNGNLHLEFLRDDLVRKFNELAGGRRLKHDASARRQSNSRAQPPEECST
jgi:hypothetical protein